MVGIGLGLGLSQPGASAGAAPVTEFVKNGDFATDTDWTKSAASVTISGGAAHFAAAAGTRRLYQASLGTYVLGNTYRVTGTVSNYSAGVLSLRIGTDSSGMPGTGTAAGSGINSDGPFSADITITTLTDQYHSFTTGPGGQFDLDDLSIVPL